jgi:hypothetical protein
MQEALHAVKGHTIVGWDSTVTALGAVPVIKRMIDRVLGVNQYSPPVRPYYRPFSFQEIYRYMVEQNFDQETYGSAKIKIDPADIKDQVILVPSIKWMEHDEHKETLTLWGEFGKIEGKVTIDSVVATVKKWESSKIVIQLLRTGKGSFGDTLVTVNDRESNVVPLTRWTGTINMKMTMKIFGEPGPWTETHCSKLILRADVHKYRDLPGRELVAGYLGTNMTYFKEAAQEMSCQGASGGEGKMGECRSVYDASQFDLRWSPNLPEDIGLKPNQDHYFLFVGNMNLKTKKFTYIPADTYYFNYRMYCNTGGTEQLVQESKMGPMFNGNGTDKNWSQKHPHSLDADFNLKKETFSVPDYQGMPNLRTFENEFKAEAVPTDKTDG